MIILLNICILAGMAFPDFIAFDFLFFFSYLKGAWGRFQLSLE